MGQRDEIKSALLKANSGKMLLGGHIEVVTIEAAIDVALAERAKTKRKK